MDNKVKGIVSLYNKGKERWRHAIDESLEDFKFVLGDQWTSQEKAYIKKTGRTADVVYNKILPRLNNLLGTEQQNRRQIRFFPSDADGSEELAELANQIFHAIRNDTKLEEAIEKAFSSGLIMQIPAWIEIGVTLDDVAMKKYDINVANSFSIIPDPDYRDYFLRDCSWIIKEKWMTPEEIQVQYGKEVKELKISLWDRISSTDSIHSIWNRNLPQAEFYDKEDGKYKVIELQERVIVNTDVYRDKQTGEYISAKDDERKELRSDNNYEYVTSFKKKRIHITTTVPYLDMILIDELSPIDTDMYDVIPYCSFDYNHIKSESSSFVKALKPIQKSYNKREMQYLAYLDNGVNSPIFFHALDKEAKEEYDRIGNRPGASFIYNSSKSAPFRLQPTQVPYDIKSKLIDDEANMNDISAINSAMRGESQYSDESGRLFNMKAQVAGVTVNHYFNNLSKTRKMIGDYILETLPYVYGESNRTVEIANEKGQTKNIIINLEMGDSLINGIRNFKGKVVVDEGQTSTSYRQEKFMQKMNLLSIYGVELVNPEWLLKDSELPDWEEQVKYMQQVLGVQAESQARQEALTEEGEILNQIETESRINNEQSNYTE